MGAVGRTSKVLRARGDSRARQVAEHAVMECRTHVPRQQRPAHPRQDAQHDQFRQRIIVLVLCNQSWANRHGRQRSHGEQQWPCSTCHPDHMGPALTASGGGEVVRLIGRHDGGCCRNLHRRIFVVGMAAKKHRLRVRGGGGAESSSSAGISSGGGGKGAAAAAQPPWPPLLHLPGSDRCWLALGALLAGVQARQQRVAVAARHFEVCHA